MGGVVVLVLSHGGLLVHNGTVYGGDNLGVMEPAQLTYPQHDGSYKSARFVGAVYLPLISRISNIDSLVSRFLRSW